MTFLPIVARELLVASRRKRTYAVRFVTAAVAALAGTVLLFVLDRIPLVPGVGRSVFQILAWFWFFYCLALSANTADCISEENREGTLGLLFLTDLNGWDVALGKLFANSLQSFYAILGTFPVAAIVLTLGGVSLGQFCKVALALLNVFFFAQTAGLLASVSSRASIRVGVACFQLLHGFLVGPLFLAGLTVWTNGGQVGALTLLLAAFSPGYAFWQAMLPIGERFYWFSLLVVHLTAWLFLAAASWRLPHCWQEKASPARLRWRDRFRQWLYGPPAFREDLRQSLVGINPFLWLVSRNRLNSFIFFPSFLILAGCWAILGWYQFEPSEREAFFIAIFIIMHSTLISAVAGEASRHLEEHRRSGALEFILCSTPLAPGDFMAGQWLALRRLFLRPLIVVLVSDLAMLLVNHTRLVQADFHDKLIFDAFLAVATIMLLVDIIAAGWVGMWRAMANRRAKQNMAVVETVLLLLAVPLGILACIVALQILLERWLPEWLPDPDDSPGYLIGLWFVLALGIAAGASRMGRRSLRTRFREMAVVQTDEPIGIMGHLGRWLGRAFRL